MDIWIYVEVRIVKEYIERAAAMESILGLTIVDPAVAQYADAAYYTICKDSLPQTWLR